ncbi:MAG: hypothetical protein OK441_02205 [Thaumarchaeota archaeon]|nr:hypothetical protein [Nitrososphaerota archaeon]
MTVSQPEPRATAGRYLKKGNIAWAIAVVLVAILAIYALESNVAAPGPTYTQTTSTTYEVAASSVIQSAVQQNPAGYIATATVALKPGYPGEQGAEDAILNGDQGQAAANITVAVFDSANASQAYYNLFTSNVRGLAGYTDVTSVLASYEQYGSCYAYGEDVDGIAVANGVCTDGNVFLQAHLSSSESFAQLEDDLSSLMGSMYQSV